jgi:hypothetical protein
MKRAATDVDNVTLHIEPRGNDDLEAMTELTQRLRGELLELDVKNVRSVEEEAAPDNAKGIMEIAGWLAVQFGAWDGLRQVISVLRSWTIRTNRTVELSIAGDTLKIGGLSPEHQEKLIDAFIARHASSA